MKVVVIGAGVIGVSIAVELARRGADVTVVERKWPGAGASSTSYAWVNSNNKEPASYFDLNQAGLQAHADLAPEGNWLQQSGHVEFATDPEHRSQLDARVQRLDARGYQVETISLQRARELVPGLIVPEGCDSAVFFPQEAYCYPLLYLGRQLSLAADLGVKVLTGVSVERFDIDDLGAQVVLSDGSVLPADRVVSAVGRWTNDVVQLAGFPPLMAEFEEPGDVTVGYLAITNPVPVPLDRIMTSPLLNVRPAGGGRLLLQALDLDSTATPDEIPATDSPLALELLARLRGVLENTGGATIAELQVGQRAMPRDGLSVIGPAATAPWLYIVATHSGVTLAPLLGAGVADEIFGTIEPLFADFRPDRLWAAAETAPLNAPRRPGEQ